jgi:hypothetical protein
MAKPKKRKKPPIPRDCKGMEWNFEELCAYLTALQQWTLDIWADYLDVRIALCNVEKQAFFANGKLAKRFCQSGGPLGDPTPPPKPPKWT